jgi:hypothetical protein
MTKDTVHETKSASGEVTGSTIVYSVPADELQSELSERNTKGRLRLSSGQRETLRDL